jgi:hypothetical protein
MAKHHTHNSAEHAGNAIPSLDMKDLRPPKPERGPKQILQNARHQACEKFLEELKTEIRKDLYGTPKVDDKGQSVVDVHGRPVKDLLLTFGDATQTAKNKLDAINKLESDFPDTLHLAIRKDHRDTWSTQHLKDTANEHTITAKGVKERRQDKIDEFIERYKPQRDNDPLKPEITLIHANDVQIFVDKFISDNMAALGTALTKLIPQDTTKEPEVTLDSFTEALKNDVAETARLNIKPLVIQALEEIRKDVMHSVFNPPDFSKTAGADGRQPDTTEDWTAFMRDNPKFTDRWIRSARLEKNVAEELVQVADTLTNKAQVSYFQDQKAKIFHGSALRFGASISALTVTFIPGISGYTDLALGLFGASMAAYSAYWAHTQVRDMCNKWNDSLNRAFSRASSQGTTWDNAVAWLGAVFEIVKEERNPMYNFSLLSSIKIPGTNLKPFSFMATKHLLSFWDQKSEGMTTDRLRRDILGAAKYAYDRSIELKGIEDPEASVKGPTKTLKNRDFEELLNPIARKLTLLGDRWMWGATKLANALHITCYAAVPAGIRFLSVLGQ